MRKSLVVLGVSGYLTALTCGHDAVNKGKGVISYQAPPCPVLTLSRQAVALAGHTAAQERPAVVSVESRSTFLEKTKTEIWRKRNFFPLIFVVCLCICLTVCFLLFWFLVLYMYCKEKIPHQKIKKNTKKNLNSFLLLFVHLHVLFYLLSLS